MIAARQAQHLGQHTEVDAVVRVAVDHGMHGAVNVQQHPVFAAPVGKPGVGGKASGQVVMHDDRRADLLGILGAFIHLFGGWRGDVQVRAFSRRFGLGLWMPSIT